MAKGGNGNGNGGNNNGNGKPTAVADFASVQEDVTLVATGNVLSNDIGQNIAVTSAGTFVGTYGTLVLKADGSYTYTLNDNSLAVQSLAAGQVVSDVFSYTMAAGGGNGIASSATLTVNVTGTNDAPVAVADFAAVKEDTNTPPQPNPVSGNVLTNDTDVDTLDTHRVTTVNGSAANVGVDVAGNYGTLHLNVDGSYSYTLDNSKASVQALAEGQQVTDVFTYINSDNYGGTSSATLTVTVTGTNDAAVIGTPTVADVIEDVAVNGAGNLTAAGSISITDMDQGQSTFQTTVTGANGNLGSLSLAASGGYTYTVADNAVDYLGTGDSKVDTFTVTSFDGTQKQVSFTIHGVSDAPVVTVPDSITLNEGDAAPLNIIVAAGDVGGTLGNVTISGLPLDAALSVGTNNGNGSWTLTPDQLTGLMLTAGEETSATLTVTATSSEGTTASTSQNIALTVVDVAPTLSVTISGTAQEGQTLTAQAVANDSDATFTYLWQSSSDNGNTWNNINNAIGSSYALQENDENKLIRVVAASQDPGGIGTSVASAATSSVIDITSVPLVTIAVGNGLPLQETQSFNQFLGFGDSNIDSGYFFTHPISNNQILQNQYNASVAAGGGIPTSLGGSMNSQLLAADYGLTAIPIGESGGTNYAASGATITGSLQNSLAPSITSQIQTYLASTGDIANPNALYLISGGGNDAKIAATLSGPTAQNNFMISEANYLVSALTQLQADGARYIVIDDGAGMNALTAVFANTLWAGLDAGSVHYIVADVSALDRQITANPAPFGITNTVQPPAGPFTQTNPYNPANGGADINPNPGLIARGWALYATTMQSPTAGQSYLWADNEHLAAAGQQAEANYDFNRIQNAIPTPGATLTATAGLFGEPDNSTTTTAAFQWQRSFDNGQTWTAISGATGKIYTVKNGDEGARLRVIASLTDDTGQTATATSPATFIVVDSPSATETPTLNVTGAVSGNEGAAIPLTITATPVDGDDTLSITISGVPSDATLSAGTNNGNGNWTLTPAQLTGLTLTAGEDTTATLTVIATNAEGSGASVTQNIALTVNPIAEAPVLTITNPTLSVNENGIVGLGISVGGDADDAISVTITGVPINATLSAGTHNQDGSWTLTQAQINAGVTLTAGEDIATPATLTVTAANTTTGEAASSTGSISLAVNPIPEAPTLAITNNLLALTEGQSIALPISVSGDADDAISVTITGVPTNATLSAGTNNGNGNWTLTPAQLTGLTLAAGEDIATPATLTVTASNTTTGEAASSTGSITLSVAPAAEAPSLAGTPSTVTANTNGSVALPIVVTPQDADDAVSVTISRIPSDATLSDASGPLIVTNGSITLTPAQLAGLTLHAGSTPAALTVTATNAEGSGASATQDIALTVNQVALPPVVTVPGPITVNEGTDAALNITVTAADTDDTLGNVMITGLPSDATLTDGNNDPLTISNGSITLTQAQLAGLTLHTGESSATLSVTAQASEGSSTATSAAQTIALTVNPAAEAPSLAGTATSVTVNESASAPLPIVVTPQDGDDNVSVTVAGVPAGATLSAGTNNGDGTWTLTPEQLPGLTFTAGEETSRVNFSDNFSPPSGLWSNSVGNWTASGGQYFAQNPNNNPLTYSGLPYNFTNSNLSLTVTVNALSDGGLWLDTDGSNQNGVLLVLGGWGYGQGGRGGIAGNSAYWHIAQNGSLSGAQDLVAGVFTPDGTYTITVNVNGNTYTAYNDPDGIYDNNSVLLTTLVDNTFSSGRVGLYDDQPNVLTGGGFGPATSFSNFSVSGTTVMSTLTVTATNTEDAPATASQQILLTINPAPEAPGLTITNNSLTLNEGQSIALPISVSGDADDTISVTITGAPADLTLSAGTNNGNGNWTLTPAQLTGLTLTAGEDIATPATLTVTASNTTTGEAASSTGSISLSVTPVPEAPALTITNNSLTLNEGQSVALPISVSGDADDTISVTITGVPTDATLSAGTQNQDGSWMLTPAQLAGLQFTAGQTSATLHVDAVSLEGNSSAEATADITVSVNAPTDDDSGPEPPALRIASTALSVGDGGTVALGISVSGDADDSISVTITGVPADARLSAGTRNADGSWTLTADEINAGVNLIAGEDLPNPVTLTVSATNNTAGEAAFSPPTGSGSLAYTTVDDPGEAQTQLYGINNAGVMVGAGLDQPFNVGGRVHSFIAPSTNFDVTLYSTLYGINDTGEFVGASPFPGGPFYGTLGNITIIQGVFGAENAIGINNAGVIVVTGEGQVLIDQGGNFANLVVSGATSYDWVAINNRSQIAGTANGGAFSFIGPLGGPYQMLALPAGYIVHGLNKYDQIVGYDGLGNSFLMDSTGTIYPIAIPGVGTRAHGINDNGEIVGLYVQGGNEHGFETTVANVIAAATGSLGPTITLTVAPVAEVPELMIYNHALSVSEDGTVALGIGVSGDADDSISVTIAGVPTDATLTDGNNDPLTISNGSITLTQAQLAGLTLHTGESSATLSVTAQASEGSSTATSAAQTVSVNVTPVAEAPSLTIGTRQEEIFFDQNGSLVMSGGSPGDAQFVPGVIYYNSINMTTVNNSVFFFSWDPVAHWQLFKTDGVTTTMVTDVNPVLFPSGPANQELTVNGTLFFAADDGVHGSELWRSDGTSAGTTMVADINPNGSSVFAYNGSSPAADLTNINGMLYFDATDGTDGNQLWRSDGTAAGTVMVTNFHVLTNNPPPYDLNYLFPKDLTNVNGTLFFLGYGKGGGMTLWRSDGTAAGTAEVIDLVSGDIGGHSAADLTNVSGTLFFSLNGTGSSDLWKSDGTAAGTVLVYDLNASNSPGFGPLSPADLTNINGALFFRGSNGGDPFAGQRGYELWKSDGTTAGTEMLTNIIPSNTNISFWPVALTNFNNELFFIANDGNGNELWKSDGTVAGTVMVKDFDPAATGYPMGNLFDSYVEMLDVNGTLFFATETSTGGQLWKSDGTTAGTELIASGVNFFQPLASLLSNGLSKLSVNEGQSVALPISVTPQDGDDVVSVTVAGVPLDATLSAGTHNQDGSWTLTLDQLTGLTLMAGEETSATLTVTATNAEGTAASTSRSIALTVKPVTEAPTLTITNSSLALNEGQSIALPISVSGDADDSISVTITGVPTNATLSAGTNDGYGNWTLTQVQINAGVTLTAGEDIATSAALTITATNTATGEVASTTGSIALAVNPVPEAPRLTITNNSLSVNEGQSIALPISVSGDADDTISVTITGVPTGATLSAGIQNQDGSWTLTQAQINAGVNLTAGEDVATLATLTVTATNTATGEVASAAGSISLAVNPAPEAPALMITNGSLSVNEGQSIALPISVTPQDGDDVVSITITGVPSDATLSAGTHNPNGSWTLSPTQLAGLQLTAGEITSATLKVTATNLEGPSASTTQKIVLTVNPVAEAPSLSGTPSTVTANTNGSVALPIVVTPQDTDDAVSVTISGIPSDATLSDTRGSLTVTNGSITLTLAQLTGLTLHAGLTPAAMTVTATNMEGGTASSSQNLFLTINSGDAYLWGSSDYPAQTTPGDHIYAPAIALNTGLGFDSTLYGETTSNYSVSGPDVITDKVLTFDPFLLPENGGAQAIETSTINNFPFRYSVIFPSISSTQAEGVAVYETQDGNGNSYLNQVFVTRNGADSSLTVGTPMQIEGPLTDAIENPLFVSPRNSNGVLASYSVAWDQYNAIAQTYTVNFQIFNADGTASSPVETPISLTGVTGGKTSLPGWIFKSGGGAYVLAYAKLNTSNGRDVVQFQGYNEDGTTNSVNFTINPNLSHYATGAINQITLEQNGQTHTLVTSPIQFAQYSAATGSEYGIVWNETVIDSNGTHNQVEFAIFKSGTGVVSRTTFQIADGLPQDVKLQIQNDVAVVEYGDNTATNLVEFDASGHQLGSLTVATTQTAQNIMNFGDGRVGVVYDNLVDSSGTSQVVTNIYDFRTAGVTIDDSGLMDGVDKYVAGTKFNDTFVGENHVNNTYYFIGQNTSGQGPSDSFTGGSNGWNVAILPDAESNYTITSLNGTTTLTNTGDPQHAGTLALINVQALAFNPAADPSGNPGTLVATGDRLEILGPLPNGGEPISIANGSTLELNTPDAGTVTFAGTTGTLQLDSSSAFAGQISGFGGQDGIDLTDIGFGANTTLGYSGDSTQGALTVTDGARTANLTLLGQYMASSFAIASDGHGGTLVTDPPPDSSIQPTLVSQPHA